MLIFLDGLDNVGKTTQIKKIINHFNKETFMSIHHTAVKQKTTADYIKRTGKWLNDTFELCAYILNKGNSLIADRCQLSEMVYSSLYRGYNGSYVLDIEKQYPNLMEQIHLITLIDEPHNVIARHDGNSHSINIVDKAYEIDSFADAHNKSNIKHKLLLNISGRDEDEVFKIILNFIKGTK